VSERPTPGRRRAGGLPAGSTLAAAALLVACSGRAGRGGATPPADTEDLGPATDRRSLAAELEADVLIGYDRDEPLDVDVRTIDPGVGGARIGVGPGDVWVGFQVGVATSRWPLVTDAETPAAPYSLALRSQVSRDLSAAWVVDELSWRLTACDKVAVVPLRLTSLYARDGDRWVPVVEHLSLGRAVRSDERADFGLAVEAAPGRVDQDQALTAAVEALVGATRPIDVALVDQAVLVPPGPAAPLRGRQIATTPWGAPGATVEAYRLGTVGRDPVRAGVAYWVGTLAVPAGVDRRVRMRATFVFERIKGGWALAHGHVSLPEEDADLAARFLGPAVTSFNPLRVDCRRLR
jgi:ketosteroid isomerase-like protein